MRRASYQAGKGAHQGVAAAGASYGSSGEHGGHQPAASKDGARWSHSTQGAGQEEHGSGSEAKVADGGEENLKCSTCVEAKATKAPHPKHGVREPYETLAIVAANVCGPMRVASRHGSKYFVTFTDLGTRHTWVTEIKKSEVYTSFLDWKAEAERQSGKKLKVLRTDNGAEFINAEFNTYLKSKGIRRQLTVPKGWVIRDVETGKVTATRDVTFYERDTYLEWKGRKQGAVLKEAAASRTPVEEMIDGSEEGIGAANGSSDNDDYEDHTTLGFVWVWEVQELSSPSTAVEESEEENDKGEEAGDNSTDEAGEVEAEISNVEESVAESASTGFSDPWRIIDTGDNEKVVAEVEDLLVDGAIVIGRETEGDTVQQGADDNAEAEKGGAENESEEMG
ncbi:unnamed protein product [Closterium sp. NIES-53]